MVVVISHPNTIDFELETVLQLFDNGLEHFHFRKENWEEKECVQFLAAIPEAYHSRIRIHQHHELLQRFPKVKIHLKSNQNWVENAISKSYHKIEEIENSDFNWNYCFLSPVFNSITKANYKAKFNVLQLKTYLKSAKKNVIALGGITAENADEALQIGFKGVAVLGSIWQEKTIANRVAVYQNICQKVNQTY